MPKPKNKRARSQQAHGRRKRQVTFYDLLLLWNYEQAARFLGIGKKTLMIWVARGLEDVPFVRLNRLIRFRPEALRKWVEEREQRSAHFVAQQATVTSQPLEAR